MNQIDKRIEHVSAFLATVAPKTGIPAPKKDIGAIQMFMNSVTRHYGIVGPKMDGKPEDQMASIEAFLEANAPRIGLKYSALPLPVETEPVAQKLEETDPNFVKGLFAKLESLGNRLDAIESELEELPKKLSATLKRSAAAKKSAKRSTRR